MNKNSRTQCLVTICVSLVLTACGGSTGTTGNTVIDPSPGSGIDRLGVSIGTITGFGSIIVNGVRFDTNSARFDIDDNASTSTQTDLSVGDIVAVTFQSSSPTVALTVTGDEAVEGRVDRVTLATGELLVAGQTVVTTADTSFDISTGVQSLADIQMGDFVEISGFFDANGSIQATRVERKPTSGETEVHGVVTAKTADTFMIGALTINYTNIPAVIDDGFPNGTFNNGDLVEVKGSTYSGDILLATKIEPDGLGAGEGGASPVNTSDFGDAEIEGLITRFGSTTDFSVAGIPVRLSSSTQFEGGTTADLALNARVEVEGQFSNGVLIASEVEIERSTDLRVTALVNSVNPTAGTLTLLGITVQIDTNTRFEDKSETDLGAFSLSNIGVGDYLEIQGGVDTGSANILAQSVEREDVPDIAGEDTKIRATVDAVNQPFLTIAGVSVDTSNARFQNIGDTPISAEQFFNSVQIGDLVEVEGFQTGQASIAADEVEFED